MEVMLVEDNLKIRELIKQIVMEEMPGVATFFELEDGAEVLVQYEKHMPDWVLMDIQMDRMDGITASEKLLKRFPKAKIIIVTQYDDAAFRSAAKEIGVQAYVLKENLLDIPVLLKSTLI